MSISALKRAVTSWPYLVLIDDSLSKFEVHLSSDGQVLRPKILTTATRAFWPSGKRVLVGLLACLLVAWFVGLNLVTPIPKRQSPTISASPHLTKTSICLNDRLLRAEIQRWAVEPSAHHGLIEPSIREQTSIGELTRLLVASDCAVESLWVVLTVSSGDRISVKEISPFRQMAKRGDLLQ